MLLDWFVIFQLFLFRPPAKIRLLPFSARYERIGPMKTYKVVVDSENNIRWFDFVSGNLHRESGPAIEYADGSKEWYLNGQKLSEKQFNARKLKTAADCDGKIVEIDGKKYQLKLV